MPKTNAPLMDNLTLSTRRICSYSVVGELWAQSFGLSLLFHCLALIFFSAISVLWAPCAKHLSLLSAWESLDPPSLH